uniref:Uncharacterized protein n=1 Tax=Ananas comosus var. bracteatus TaxID=296719 RepID=A0A6V7Q5K7_ANACO|nr:unnamed protein product [Ananas comosus var. bracteatus]
MISPRIHMNRRVRLVRAMQPPGSNRAEPAQDNPKVTNLNHTSSPGLPKFSLFNFATWYAYFTLDLGMIIFVALPSYKRFLTIEDQVDKTAVAVVEMVEQAAETIEKISSEVAEALPENSELKETVLKVEHIAEEVIKDAELVDSVINKVDDFVDEVDAMVEPIIEGKFLIRRESREQKAT